MASSSGTSTKISIPEAQNSPAKEAFGAMKTGRPDPLVGVPHIWDISGDNEELCAQWQAAFDELPIIPEAKKEESIEEWGLRMEKQMELLNRDGDEDLSNPEAKRASRFRSDWEFLWSPNYGAFEDTTRIPPMRFAFKPARDAMPEDALQIFSAKVAATSSSLPFDVFGMVAVRDAVDHNRNIVFCHTRDNCQTLTKEHPYLILTGPTRAVVLSDPVIIEVDLSVKGTTDSEDEKLSSLAVLISSSDTLYSHLWKCDYTSKLSTIEFTLGHIVRSVEATIFVQVTRGSWPVGFSGQFYGFATGDCGKSKTLNPVYDTSVNDEEIILLDSRGEKVPVTGDGNIELSRHIVSVDIMGELKVYVKACGGDNNVTETWKVFKPLKAGRSCSMLDIGFCKMEVTVAWSLISCFPVHANALL